MSKTKYLMCKTRNVQFLNLCYLPRSFNMMIEDGKRCILSLIPNSKKHSTDPNMHKPKENEKWNKKKTF